MRDELCPELCGKSLHEGDEMLVIAEDGAIATGLHSFFTVRLVEGLL
jgi:hypothetical protein